ncbi:hypothetical protein AAVH_25449 [Aphelenchoides avenae]|nr:hypothetical protein AAVH_25449 [Aphelenchus avenae]
MGFWGNRNGLIIGPRSIYCQEDKYLKRQKIVIGLRTEETQIGCRVNFDVYYSDLLDSFVAFRVQVLSDPLFTMYNMRDEETVKIEIRLSVRNFDEFFFTHPFLGPISDRQNLLRTLPYADSSRQLGDVAVYVAECDISRASRFEIVELPTETIKLVEKAEELMATTTIKAKGIVLSAKSGFSLVFVKKFSCAEFYLQDTRFSVGTVIQFESKYDRDLHVHIILTANEALPREPPFACDWSAGYARFKLNVRFHQTYDLLCHPMFGYIDDPQKMLPTRISHTRPLDIFVKHDTGDRAQTWLIFDGIVAMSTNAGRNASHYYSDDDADDDTTVPKHKEGVHFCQTESVKDRKRRKLRERNFKKRAEGKSVWDPRYQRYDPPKRPAGYAPPSVGVSDDESSYGINNLRI